LQQLSQIRFPQNTAELCQPTGNLLLLCEHMLYTSRH